MVVGLAPETNCSSALKTAGSCLQHPCAVPRRLRRPAKSLTSAPAALAILRVMRHLVRAVAAVGFALSTVETCCSRSSPSATSCAYSLVRIVAFAHLTVCSGWCCDVRGLGGEMRCCWPPSTVGIAMRSIDVGAAARDVLADHGSIQSIEP